jgi:hypothetical protein
MLTVTVPFGDLLCAIPRLLTARRRLSATFIALAKFVSGSSTANSSPPHARRDHHTARDFWPRSAPPASGRHRPRNGHSCR